MRTSNPICTLSQGWFFCKSLQRSIQNPFLKTVPCLNRPSKGKWEVRTWEKCDLVFTLRPLCRPPIFCTGFLVFLPFCSRGRSYYRISLTWSGTVHFIFICLKNNQFYDSQPKMDLRKS